MPSNKNYITPESETTEEVKFIKKESNKKVEFPTIFLDSYDKDGESYPECAVQ